MMIYAQDQFGYLSDEMLDEIAKRLELNTVQVTETLAYYSMLRRKPAGRFHIQVCTNISCMLRGGNELYQHVQNRLGIGNKQVSPIGNVFSGRSRMHGRLHRRSRHAGELRLPRKSRSRQGRRNFRAVAGGRVPPPVPVISGALHEPNPAEVPVISKRFGIKNSRKIDIYMQTKAIRRSKKL